MKTASASIACAAMRQPSKNRCGTRLMISRSLNAPGSDSSAFATTYAGPWRFAAGGTRLSFLPIGKPAPPRPRSDAFEISSITLAGFILRARTSWRYPPTARYSSRRVRSRPSAPLRTVSSAATQLLNEPGHVLGRRRLSIPVVDDDDRGIAAAAGAFDQPKRELAVLGRLAGRDPELALECVDDLLGAHESAGEVGADLNEVLPDRREVVHVVEGRHGLHFGGCHVERISDLPERLR